MKYAESDIIWLKWPNDAMLFMHPKAVIGYMFGDVTDILILSNQN